MVKLMEIISGMVSSTNTMNLVFFKDAAEPPPDRSHPPPARGNAMLVVGGVPESLTRFDSFKAGFKCFSIEITRGYGVNEFRDDLKTLYHQTGIEGTPTVFLFTDTQIVTESFVEDINNILNSGEVPALFDQQDKDRICADIRPYAESMGLSMSKDVLYNTFINRVRDNLHSSLHVSCWRGFSEPMPTVPSLITAAPSTGTWSGPRRRSTQCRRGFCPRWSSARRR